MDAFITAEAANHYSIKIRGIVDDISVIRGNVNVVASLTETNWKGESGQAALEVINKFNEKFAGVSGSLSNIVNIVASSIGEEEET